MGESNYSKPTVWYVLCIVTLWMRCKNKFYPILWRLSSSLSYIKTKSYYLAPLSQWKEAAKLMGTIWNLLLIGIILRGGDLSDIFLSKTLKYSEIVTPRNISQLSNLFHCVWSHNFTLTVPSNHSEGDWKLFLCCDCI